MESLFAPDLEPKSRALGRRGEALAAKYLESKGYRLVMSNFTVPIGRNVRGAEVSGEIDLIALDPDGTLCFIEVKTRSTDVFADPATAVDRRKQRQIARAARVYKRIFSLVERPSRFDVIAIVGNDIDDPAIEHLCGYWDGSQALRKRKFSDNYRDYY